MVPYCGFILHFLITNEIDPMTCSFLSCAHFSLELSFVMICINYLYISYTNYNIFEYVAYLSTPFVMFFLN